MKCHEQPHLREQFQLCFAFLIKVMFANADVDSFRGRPKLSKQWYKRLKVSLVLSLEIQLHNLILL